ncbi:MAG: hypothetical protein H6Q43_1806 [Deltaproteobacteria bacterium]|nr:hypothetical protein [Deltaproteobacteria bacterium]
MQRSAVFFAVVLMAAAIFVSGLEPPVSAMGKSVEAPRLSIEEFRLLIGNSEVVIFDVRLGDEWKKSNEKIQGAVREDPEKYKQWAVKYPKEKTLVFY